MQIATIYIFFFWKKRTFGIFGFQAFNPFTDI